VEKAYQFWRAFQDKILARAAALVLLGCTLLALLEVVRRYGLGQSFEWQQDAVTLFILAAVFLYFGISQRHGAHLNVNLLFGILEALGPRGRRAIEVIKVLVTIISFLFLLAVVAVVLTGIWFLIHKTSFGRVVRAGIQRPDMVAALGIRLQPYMTTIVMLGVGMAALGGALFAPITNVHPAMGAEIITVAFVVVVIGGLGSFWGVVLAALLVGVVRGITIHFVPAAGEASMYVLMFLVLLFRPRGLLGERIEKFE